MLTIEGLRKVFPPPQGLQRLFARTASTEPVTAIADVDLAVRSGEIVGLVGPNGAGKTTLIKIVSTLLDPTDGRVAIDGRDVVREPDAARAAIGLVLSDERSLYWRLDGRDNLEFFGVMQGLTHHTSRTRADELLERFDLARRDKLVYGYSSGMRARLSIARAMMSEPRLLVLDEPTRALDPIAAADVGEILQSAAADGAAILLSSHRLDEIESTCDRLVAMVGGRVRHAGAVSALQADWGFAAAVRALLVEDSPSSEESGP